MGIEEAREKASKANQQFFKFQPWNPIPQSIRGTNRKEHKMNTDDFISQTEDEEECLAVVVQIEKNFFNLNDIIRFDTDIEGNRVAVLEVTDAARFMQSRI